VAQVYSFTFGVGNLAPGGHVDLGPLDPAFIYVVRDITGFLSTTVTEAMRVQFSVLGNTLWSFGISGYPGRPYSWQGHVVVPGLFTLTADCFGASGFVNYAVSGYRLTTP
jgi:hypothetical protein